MSYLAPPKLFETKIHWFQSITDYKLPQELASELASLNSDYEYLILGKIKNIKRFGASVYNPRLGTRVKYYDAYNIIVGDWLANNTTSFAWRINKIYTVSDNRYQISDSIHFYAKMVDYNKFNASFDRHSRGLSSPLNFDFNAILFTIDDEGQPVLPGLDTNAVDPNFSTVVLGRFAAFNIKVYFISINQTNAGNEFKYGDAIYIDTITRTFKKSLGNPYCIGLVTSVGVPNQDYFTFEPFGKYRSWNELNLQGAVGTIYYADPSGINQLVIVKPTSPVFPIYQIIDTEGNAILITNPFEPSPASVQTSTFSTIFVSTGTINTLYASDIVATNINTVNLFAQYISTFELFVSSLTANNISTINLNAQDITSNQLLTNYIGSQNNDIYFTSPFHADLGTISTLFTDGIYLRGQSTQQEGLLYADSFMNLYWNGEPILNQLTPHFAENIIASDVVINNIIANYIGTNEDYIYFTSPISGSEGEFDSLKVNIIDSDKTLLISEFESESGTVKTLLSEGIRIRDTTNNAVEGLLKTDEALNLYWNGAIIGYNDSDHMPTVTIDNLTTDVSHNNRIIASDTIINSIRANYIGSSDELLYITSPFKSNVGQIEALTASEANIDVLNTNTIGTQPPHQSIEFLSKFDARNAVICELEVSSLKFINNMSDKTIILASSNEHRLIYSYDGISWIRTKWERTKWERTKWERTKWERIGREQSGSEQSSIQQTPTDQITAIKYNGKEFLAAGSTSKLYKSIDGISWADHQTLEMYQKITCIHWFKSHWILAGIPKSGTEATLMVSQDSLTWIAPTALPGTIYTKLVDNGHQLLALGQASKNPNAVIINSSDLINWSESETPSFSEFVNAADWDGKTWIAAGKSGSKSLLRSKNGTSWSNINIPKLKSGHDIKWNKDHNYWLVCGLTDDSVPIILRSTDTITWTQATLNSTIVHNLLWAPPHWLAYGDTTQISKTGLTWTPIKNLNNSCLATASVKPTINKTLFFQNAITTLNFNVSTPEFQYIELTPEHQTVFINFYKTTESINATEKTLVLVLYAAYFADGHTINIQTKPYEADSLSLDEYKNIKYTLYSPNKELTLDPLNSCIESTELTVTNILHLTFYQTQWVRSFWQP